MSMIEKADINDIHVFEQADINDYNLTMDADHDPATLQAADAYLTQNTYACKHVMVRIALDQPGVGGGDSTSSITLYISVQNPAGTEIKGDHKTMYYDETASGIIYADFYVVDVNAGAALTPARIKVDWYATAGANAPDSVKVHLIKFWNYKGTVTEV